MDQSVLLKRVDSPAFGGKFRRDEIEPGKTGKIEAKAKRLFDK